MSNAKMVTFSGVEFDLLEPTPEMIRLDDITHALARLNRFTGHTRGGTLSVAQHSVLVADLVAWLLGTPRNGTVKYFLGPALLHDAHEAYTGDISTPMKNAFKGFYVGESDARVAALVKGIQHPIQRVIDARFGIADFDRPAVKDIVKKADVAALFLERTRWMAGSDPKLWPAPDALPSPSKWSSEAMDGLWPAALAEAKFRERLEEVGIS